MTTGHPSPTVSRRGVSTGVSVPSPVRVPWDETNDHYGQSVLLFCRRGLDKDYAQGFEGSMTTLVRFHNLICESLTEELTYLILPYSLHEIDPRGRFPS